MTSNEIFIKNFTTNFRKYSALFICNSLSMALFFMYTTIYFNPQIRYKINESLEDMLVAILIAIIFFTVCFFNYAYTSLLKSRNSEFGVLLCLGMLRKEIKEIILIENTIITTLSTVLGLLTGTIFSRLFFLGTLNVLGIRNIKFQITFSNYLVTVGVFMLIFVITIFAKDSTLKHMDVIALLDSEKNSEKLYLNKPLLGIAGVVLMLIAYWLVYADQMHYFPVKEKSTYFVLFCFTGLYLVVSQFSGLMIFVMRRFNRYYIQNLLSFSEMNHKLSRNKDMMYIVTILISVLLFFVGYAYSKYIIDQVIDGNFLIFISSFMAALFFVATISVIYFKLFSEIDEERSRYQKLYSIGITKLEVKKYIGFELRMLLFVPIVMAVVMVFPYMWIEYLKNPLRNQILVSLVIIFSIYVLFQTIFFFIIKWKYTQAISNQ